MAFRDGIPKAGLILSDQCLMFAILFIVFIVHGKRISQ